MLRTTSRAALAAITCLGLLASACGSDATTSDPVPAATANPAAPGDESTPESGSHLTDDPRVESILARGTLRVGALPEFPFLVQDITGGTDEWAGPSWVLANAIADALGVELEVIPVSHETKVPVLASDQVDITIAPLSVTDARKEVVDFIEYSKTGVCYIGLAANERFATIDEFSDLNDPTLTLAYFQGQPTEELIAGVYPDISFRAVPGSGSVAPLEEILSGRSDIAVVAPQAAGPQVTRAYPEIATFPAGDDCLDSTEFSVPTGMAIDKGQGELLEWMRGIYEQVMDEVAAEEARIVAEGTGFDLNG